MIKYYRAENAGRIIAGIVFTIYDIVAGSAVGVYATEDKSQIEALDNLTKDPKSAVTEISQADYDSAIEKKKLTHVSEAWNYLSPPQPQAPTHLKGRGVVVVSDEPAEEVEAPVEIKEHVESVDDALKVGQVSPPAPEQVEPVSEPVVPPAPQDSKKSPRKKG